MAVLIGANGSLYVINLVERVNRGNLVRSYQIHRQIKKRANPHDRFHPIDLVIGCSNADTANLMPADILTGFPFHLLVGFD